MAITKADIHAAADQIAAAGDTPTLAKVRAALGGGSFTTISEAMAEWKASRQQQAVATPIREAAPEAITERLHAFAADLWSDAMAKANARLQQEHESLNESRKTLQAAMAEAQEMADQVTAEIEVAKTNINGLEITVADLREQLQKAITAGETLRTENASLQQQLATERAAHELAAQALGAAKEREKELAAQLSDKREALHTAQDRIRSLEHDRIVLTTEKMELLKKADLAKELQSTLEKERAERARIEGQHQSAKDMLDDFGYRLASISKDAANAAAKAEAAAAEAASRIATLEAQLAAIQPLPGLSEE